MLGITFLHQGLIISREAGPGDSEPDHLALPPAPGLPAVSIIPASGTSSIAVVARPASENR